jgi:hypothetical protein
MGLGGEMTGFERFGLVLALLGKHSDRNAYARRCAWLTAMTASLTAAS